VNTWFTRGKVESVDVGQPYSTSANVAAPAPESVAVTTFEPKPVELTQAVQRASEWTRAAPEGQRSPPSVPWSEQAPMVPGLYWWRPSLAGVRPDGPEALARLAAVTIFGGSLVVRRRKGGSSTYTTVAVLAREWAGPIAIPSDAQLEDFQEVN
jgi:hypothetical protein